MEDLHQEQRPGTVNNYTVFFFSAWSPASREGSVWSGYEHLEFDFLRVARLTGVFVGASSLVAGSKQYSTASAFDLEAARLGPQREFRLSESGLAAGEPAPLSATLRARSVRITVTEVEGDDAFPLGVNK